MCILRVCVCVCVCVCSYIKLVLFLLFLLLLLPLFLFPFLSFFHSSSSSPHSFRQRFHTQFPDLVANVERNRHLLVTHFDAHRTLQHLLHLQTNATHAWKNDLGDRSPPAFSLLTDEVPVDRTCEEAHIPAAFCSCVLMESIPLAIDSEEALQVAHDFVAQLNQALRDVDDICAILTLRRVDKIKRHKTQATYTVQVETGPVGLFWGMVDYRPKEGNDDDDGGLPYEVVVDIAHISRLDHYGNTSFCVRERNPRLEELCYCK